MARPLALFVGAALFMFGSLAAQSVPLAVGECDEPRWSTALEALAAANALNAAGVFVDSAAFAVIGLPIDENDLASATVRLDATQRVARLGRELELRSLVAVAAAALFLVDTATVRRMSNHAATAGILDLSPAAAYAWFINAASGCIAEP